MEGKTSNYDKQLRKPMKGKPVKKVLEKTKGKNARHEK